MLRELHISKLAVFDDATIDLGEGLNVFTGQTGAGKSLIIGAFELLLGLRSGGSEAGAMIRPGCEEARVSGLFEIANPKTRRHLSEIFDRPLDDSEPILITRRLFSSGRSSASVNGAPATAGMLRDAGEFLVDIHGQHDQQYLLKPSNQLEILDAFGQAEPLRERFAEGYETLRQLRRRRKELLASADLRREKLELYEFQADEIDAAELQAGEFSEVQARYVRLSNIETLQQQVGEVLQGLSGEDDAALDQLRIVKKHLGDLTRYDADALEPIAGQLAEALALLEDGSFELARYAETLDLDPQQAAETQQRLDTLNHLIHKYARDSVGDDKVASVLAYREQIGRQIDTLRSQETDLGGLDEQIDTASGELARIGEELSAVRQKQAAALKPLVARQLKELGMADAAFKVDLQSFPPDDERVGPRGLDRVEFIVRTNPGQEYQPLRKIASGGEISRIMLALKSILAGSDRISVLVFDEIDANIGGRLGSVIGRKMRQLSRGSGGDGHQVLCITHLPQIAAFADQHLHIAKQVHGKGSSRQTRTTVRMLGGEDRAVELAEMMAGADYTDTTLAQARELLSTAE